MAFYVYILRSLADGSYYKGFTEDPLRRLAQHNAGESTYTSLKVPWELVYVEACADRASAMARERNLKKATRERIEWLIGSSKNIRAQFD